MPSPGPTEAVPLGVESEGSVLPAASEKVMKKRTRREASPLHPRRNGRRSPIRKSPVRRIPIRRKAPAARIHPFTDKSLPEADQNPKQKLLRVLIVEDLEHDALLMTRELERGGYRIQSQRVDTAEGMG